MSKYFYTYTHRSVSSKLSFNRPSVASLRTSRSSLLLKKKRIYSRLQKRNARKLQSTYEIRKDCGVQSERKFRGRHFGRGAMDPQGAKVSRSKKNILGFGTSQKGFLTLSTISFILVLLCLSGALTTLGFVLKKRMTLSSHCVHSVLKLQKDLARPLDRLLKLNKPAAKLRLQRKLAQARLAAAIAIANPPAIAAAKAHLLIITQRQILLRTRQHALLLEAKVRRQQFKLMSYGKNSVESHRQFSGESLALAVIPKPFHSLSPSYNLSPDFEKAQAQSYRLKQTIEVPLIGIMGRMTKQNQISLSTACSASLTKKGDGKWLPILKKVKAQWRSSYASF